MPATTIKVPADLRDRLNVEAKDAGTTVAAVIERLLDARDRSILFARMRDERARLSPTERAEIEAEYLLWEGAAGADAHAYDRDT